MEGKPKCCFFKFSSKIQYNKVVKAQLWIYLRQVQKPTTVFVQILRLIKPMKDGTRYTGIRSLKLDMNPGTGIWQSIDVKTVMQNWLKQPESNLGIEIKAFDENGRDLAVTFPGPGEDGLVSLFRKIPFKYLALYWEAFKLCFKDKMAVLFREWKIRVLYSQFFFFLCSLITLKSIAFLCLHFPMWKIERNCGTSVRCWEALTGKCFGNYWWMELSKVTLFSNLRANTV